MTLFALSTFWFAFGQRNRMFGHRFGTFGQLVMCHIFAFATMFIGSSWAFPFQFGVAAAMLFVSRMVGRVFDW